MATAKKTTSAATVKEPKKPIAEVRKENEELHAEIEKIKKGAYCYMCDKHKPKEQFHKCTDPLVKSGVSRICKACAYDIACRKDANGEYHEPTKESVQKALRYLDKPFLEVLWNSSINESANEATGKTKHNVWTSYIKNVGMVNYIGMTYQDSDMFKEHIKYEDEKTAADVVKGREDMDTYSDYMKNKKDVVRLLGYDPFEKESVSDQPFLYANLLGILDASGEGNDDMIRTSSAISIVRGFSQQQKMDDAITKLMSDPVQFQKNSATIKSMQDSKKAITSVIKDLAAESCISLKNSKNAKKGENTWTGKIKKIKELNLREGEVNGFDIWTCKGMRQVMEMSDASIMKQLHLDESEWSDMVADQRVMIRKLQDERDNYQEISRILLRENLDLKDVLNEHSLLDLDNCVDLDELYSCFSSNYEVDKDDEDESEG